MTNENGKSFSMSPSLKELPGALISVQSELPKLAKDKTNPFFKSKYAGLETVMPATLKALTAYRLALVQTVGMDERGGTTLTTVLLHESGEWISDTQPLLLVKEDPQSQGSAITYARRYAAMSMLGLVADADDDGEAATSRTVAPKKPQPRKEPAVSHPEMGAKVAADPKSGPSVKQRGMIEDKLKRLYGSDAQSKTEAFGWAGVSEAVDGTTYDLDKLTAGREGTASKLIGWLIAKETGVPAPDAAPVASAAGSGRYGANAGQEMAAEASDALHDPPGADPPHEDEEYRG